MPRRSLARLTVAVALAACCGWSAGQAKASDPPARVDITLPRDSVTTERRVPPTATLAALLRRESLPAVLVNALVRATTTVFDVRVLRAGQAFRLTQSLAGAFREFQYDIDPSRYLRVAASAADASGLKAEIVTYPREVTEG